MADRDHMEVDLSNGSVSHKAIAKRRYMELQSSYKTFTDKHKWQQREMRSIESLFDRKLKLTENVSSGAASTKSPVLVFPPFQKRAPSLPASVYIPIFAQTLEKKAPAIPKHVYLPSVTQTLQFRNSPQLRFHGAPQQAQLHGSSQLARFHGAPQPGQFPIAPQQVQLFRAPQQVQLHRDPRQMQFPRNRHIQRPHVPRKLIL